MSGHLAPTVRICSRRHGLPKELHRRNPESEHEPRLPIVGEDPILFRLEGSSDCNLGRLVTGRRRHKAYLSSTME